MLREIRHITFNYSFAKLKPTSNDFSRLGPQVQGHRAGHALAKLGGGDELRPRR